MSTALSNIAIVLSTSFTDDDDDDNDEEDNGAYTLGSKDTEDELEDAELYDEEFDEVKSPDTITRNSFINDQEDDVVDLTPPAAVSTLGSSSLKPPPFASASVARMPSVTRMPSGAQSVAQRPSVSYCWTPPHLKTSYQDYAGLMHQFLACLLPSGIAFHDNRDIRLAMSVYGGTDYYLNLEIQWPVTFEKDDGNIFLSFLKIKALRRKTKKWLDKMNIEEQAHAKKEFESSWVMLEMAVKQEMNRMRNNKHCTVMGSQTCVKMDFPVERLTEECWDLIGDPETGVRMLVVDLEQATENQECKPASYERKVEMIGIDLD